MNKALLSFVLFLTSIAAVPAAIAQTSSQSVYLHFNQPVEIPGHVLQAGTYLFVPLDSSRGVIQVFDQHRTQLLATLYSVPATATRGPSNNFQVSLANGQNGAPALIGWYYPGSMDGYELLYPRLEQKELSASRRDVSTEPDHSLANGD